MTDVDLTEFEKLGGPRKKPCPVAAALKALKPGDRRKLEAALEASDRITGGAIVEWLRRRGVETNHQYVVSHRRLSCKCGEA